MKRCLTASTVSHSGGFASRPAPTLPPRCITTVDLAGMPLGEVSDWLRRATLNPAIRILVLEARYEGAEGTGRLISITDRAGRCLDLRQDGTALMDRHITLTD